MKSFFFSSVVTSPLIDGFTSRHEPFRFRQKQRKKKLITIWKKKKKTKIYIRNSHALKMLTVINGHFERDLINFDRRYELVSFIDAKIDKNSSTVKRHQSQRARNRIHCDQKGYLKEALQVNHVQCVVCTLHKHTHTHTPSDVTVDDIT